LLTNGAVWGIFISSEYMLIPERKKSMSILNLCPNRWLVRVRTRREGKILCRKNVVCGSRQEAQKVETALFGELAEGGKEKSSLTIRNFGEALAYFRQHSDADFRKVDTYLNRLVRDLGPVSLSRLTERFSEYWKLLREERAVRSGKALSPITRNHLLALGKTALNFCLKRGLIERNPLACFEKVPEQGRDRVLSDEESGRLLAIMKRRGSYLYWPLYFSLKNPIRVGDLRCLTRENLDWFKPWIHFYPSKTRARKQRETCLPFIDEPLLKYLKTVPDGGRLFPRIDKNGGRYPLGDFKNHWKSILAEAGINDFRWHDLKHCAITWILDGGYTERDLKNLGIQYAPAMIDRYYHADASKVLSKWKQAQKPEVVAPACGTFTKKTVNLA
jgi:integrase